MFLIKGLVIVYYIHIIVDMDTQRLIPIYKHTIIAAHSSSGFWHDSAYMCSSFAGLLVEIRKLFDHPVQGRDTAKYLLSLCQDP